MTKYLESIETKELYGLSVFWTKYMYDHQGRTEEKYNKNSQEHGGQHIEMLKIKFII